MSSRKDMVWEKGIPVPGHDKDEIRQDSCGAWIHYSKHGRNSPYGWEIDHIVPKSKSDYEDIMNLQPLQWENNSAKKNDLYYFCKVTSQGDKNIKINDDEKSLW